MSLKSKYLKRKKMSEITIRCPHCKFLITIDENDDEVVKGDEIKCIACDQTFKKEEGERI